MKRFFSLSGIFALLLPGMLLAQSELPLGGQDLLSQYPGLRVYKEGTRLIYYGEPMTEGETVVDAVDQWLSQHGLALGVGDSELVLERANEMGADLRFTVFAFNQRMDGLVVEGGMARILVLNGIRDQVVFASADLEPTPAAGFAPDLIVDATEAEMLAQRAPEALELDRWRDDTRLVIVRPNVDNNLPAAIRAWRVTGFTSDKTDYHAYTFYVNAANGEVAYVHSEVYHINVNGNISGNMSPGTLPDNGANPPVLLPLRDAPARIAGDDTAYADAAGDYSIFHIGSAPVTVTSNFVGRWVTVMNDQGSELSFSQVVTPPGPANFTYNPSPTEFNTSQVNVFVHTTGVHDFFKDRAPSYSDLDISIEANCNLNSSCNAFFSGAELNINFFNAAGGCVNTAYSTVIYHEYGHFIVNRLGLSQGAFGEGYGDSIGILAFNDPVVGRDWQGPGTFVRDIEGANIQYPCNGAIHFCGQLIAGCWWDVKNALEGSLGIPTGQDTAYQLFVDWSLITLGGQGDNSAHPATAIEVLTVDDDDGTLANGSPNYGAICQGFSDHNIDCPELDFIAFTFPSGLPTLVDPNQPTTFPVGIEAVSGIPDPSTAELFVSIDNGPFLPVPLVVTGPDLYDATLPGADCGDALNFYVRAADTGGNFETSPADAPVSSYQASSGTGLEITVDDPVETDTGWTVGDVGDDATTGIWERVDPVGTDAQPENDHSNPGIFCWVTGQHPGGTIGTNDVDDGKTTLMTPAYDLTLNPSYTVSYWRWYSNDEGGSPNADIFIVDISNNNGSSWTNVEVVGPAGPESTGGWFFHEFNVSDFVTPTSQVKLRFVASDEGTGSIVEAAIDDLLISALQCGPIELFRRGDCNQDGSRNISDGIHFLNGLFGSGGPFVCDDACDADDSGSHALADAFAMLDAVFMGIPLPEPFQNCGVDATNDGLTCDQQLGCP